MPKIADVQTFRCDGGWRTFCFLKLVAEDGTVGWSEFQESWGSPGLGAVVDALAPLVVGQDAMRVEEIATIIKAATLQSRGGANRQAAGAYENALLDIKGKLLGVPVYQLLGGPMRDRIPVYWSHCGSYRVNPRAALIGLKPVRSYDDLAELGAQVAASGIRGLKTNILLRANGDQLATYLPNAGKRVGFPALDWNPTLSDAAVDTVMAFRSGAGPGTALMLDLHFSFKTEGYRRIADAVEPADLSWLEIDCHDPASLALIRHGAPCPIASCEALYERRDLRPYLEAYAVDIPIIDVMFNGYLESLKMAALADAYELNVAPHNFYSHLASYISAHFCAAVPNLRIMEIDIDGAPWRDDIVGGPPPIEDGDFLLPTTPGWGVEINEAELRAHPPRS